MDAMADAMTAAVRCGDVRTKMLFAGLAVIVGSAAQGSRDGELQRLENACRFFGVPSFHLDELAQHFDLYYHRSGDCYLSKEAWLEARRQDDAWLH